MNIRVELYDHLRERTNAHHVVCKKEADRTPNDPEGDKIKKYPKGKEWQIKGSPWQNDQRKWLEEGGRQSGVIPGSMGFAVIDIDKGRILNLNKEAEEEFQFEPVDEALVKDFIEKNPPAYWQKSTRGYHLFYLCENPPAKKGEFCTKTMSGDIIGMYPFVRITEPKKFLAFLKEGQVKGCDFQSAINALMGEQVDLRQKEQKQRDEKGYFDGKIPHGKRDITLRDELWYWGSGLSPAEVNNDKTQLRLLTRREAYRIAERFEVGRDPYPKERVQFVADRTTNKIWEEVILPQSLQVGDKVENGLHDLKPEYEETKYLVDEWLPIGEITTLAGVGAAGKGTMTIHIAARVTNPNIETQPNNFNILQHGSVVFASEDDKPQKTLAPKFGESGGDFSKAKHLVWDGNPAFALLTELDKMPSDYIKDLKLIVLDVIDAGLDKDANVSGVVRRHMMQLTKVAEVYECAMIVVLHPRKGGEKELADGDSATDTVRGSGVWTQKARMNWMLVVDRHCPMRSRVLWRHKANVDMEGHKDDQYIRVTSDVVRWERDGKSGKVRVVDEMEVFNGDAREVVKEACKPPKDGNTGKESVLKKENKTGRCARDIHAWLKEDAWNTMNDIFKEFEDMHTLPTMRGVVARLVEEGAVVKETAANAGLKVGDGHAAKAYRKGTDGEMLQAFLGVGK